MLTRCTFLFFIISIVFGITPPVLATTIAGQVYEAETEQAIYYVNVFLANTKIGTTTNEQGRYQIRGIPAGSYKLVVQHVGYKLYTQQVFVDSLVDTLNIDIQLEPKVFTGEEIEVTAKDAVEWRQQLEIFEREFIGESSFASQCDIKNPEVLSFYVDEDNFLSAWAERVLQIHNHALGYRIYVVLDYFRWHVEGTRGAFVHFARYEDMDASSKAQEQLWTEHREYAYNRSREHFFSDVAERSLQDSVYTVYAELFNNLKRGEGEAISPTEVYAATQDTLSVHMLKYPLDLRIDQTVSEKAEPLSTLIYLAEGRILFDDWGNIVNLADVKFYGAWAEQRLADFLPATYSPSNTTD